MTADIHRLDQRDAAKLMGWSARNLRDKPDAPRNPDGTYDGVALVRWRLERHDGGESDAIRERTRKDKELADRYALENQVRRKELVLYADVERDVGTLVLAARARLLQVPGECAQNVPSNVSGVVEKIVRMRVYDALTDLANGQGMGGE